MARITRPTLDVSGTFYNPNGTLTLSGSNSEVTISGNLHIIGDLSTEGNGLDAEVTGSYDFFVQNDLDAQTLVANSTGDLVLSSSVVRVSGTLATEEKIYSPSNDLTLSSSANSQITVSGNLNVTGDISVNGNGLDNSVTGSYDFFVQNELDARGKLINSTGPLILSSSGGSVVHISGALGIDEEINFSTAVSLQVGGSEYIAAQGAFTDLKSAGNLRLRVDNDHVAGYVPFLTNTTKSYSLWNSGAHLILTSSQGVTHISGALETDESVTITGTLNLTDDITISKTDPFIYGAAGILTVDSPGGFKVRDSGNTVTSIVDDGSGNAQFSVGGAYNLLLQTNGTTRSTELKTSEVKISGSLRMKNADNSLIYANESHLILSSSIGSQITVSGGLNVLGGTATNPAYSFSGDLDTGVYSSGVNEIAITTNGSQRWYLDTNGIWHGTAANSRISNGNGTLAAPAYNFNSNPGSGLHYIDTDNIGLVVGGELQLDVSSSGDTTITGRLGIGNTPDLGTGLHIKVSDTFAGPNAGADNLVIEENGVYAGMSIFSAVAGKCNIYLGSSAHSTAGRIIYDNLDDDMQFATLNGTTRLIIDRLGNTTISGNLSVIGDIIENSSQAGTTVGTTDTIVDTFDTSDYRTTKYTVSVSSGSGWFQSQEIMLMHSGTTVSLSEYSIVALPGDILVNFDASMTGSTVNLFASGSKEENTVKLVRTTIDV